MRLVVQTNIAGAHHLWLLQAGRIVREDHVMHDHHGADQLLQEITKLVGRRQYHDIVVVRGPGSFTAIRAALVVTNMLGWLRNIPVSGIVKKTPLTRSEVLALPVKKNKKFLRPIRPWYGRRPNITVPKKRRRP